MKCKNCGHRITNVLGQYCHVKLISKRYKPIGRKCYCGCNNPIPQSEQELKSK